MRYVCMVLVLVVALWASNKGTNVPPRVPLYGPQRVVASIQNANKGVDNGVKEIFTVYPCEDSLCTGSTDGDTCIPCQINVIENSVGWVKFDISQIPDGYYIWSVEISLYVNDTYWPWWVITPDSIDPVDSCLAKLDEVMGYYESGNVYSWNFEDPDFAPGWHSYNLGPQAAQDLQNALPRNWFAVGFLDFNFSPNYYLIIDGCTNPPYLTVDARPYPPLLYLSVISSRNVDLILLITGSQEWHTTTQGG